MFSKPIQPILLAISRWLTVLSVLAVFFFTAAAPAAVYSLDTTYWNAITYGLGHSNDYLSDQQTGGKPSDIVGETGHSGGYWYFDGAGTSSVTDGSLSFRIRLAEPGDKNELTDVILIGIDANRDGRFDAVAGVSQKKGNAVYLLDPGSGLNDSPKTTSLNKTPWYVSTIVSGGNFSYKPVTATLDPGVSTVSLGTTTSTNYFADFTLPFNVLVSSLQTYKGISITEQTALGFTVITSNQLNAINEDVGGLDGTTSGTLSGITTSWIDLGAISPAARSGGGATLVWTGLVSSEWSTTVMPGSKNWRSAADSSIQDFMSGDSVLLDDTATGTTVVNISQADVTPSAVTFANNTLAYTLTGRYGITGTAMLTKTGTGTLTITNTNSYTGGTRITAGSVVVTTSGALGTGTVSLAGATLGFGGTSAFSLTNLVTTTGAATVNVTNPAGATLAGQISGTGSIAKTGTGLLALTASNGYSGGTTLTDGTLSFANNALGSTGAVTFNGGTLQWNGTNTQDLSGRFALTNGVTAKLDTNGNNVTLASGFGEGSTAGLTKLGAGTLTFTGSNGYTGVTTITNGTLQVGNGGATGALGSGAVVNNGTLAFNRADAYTLGNVVTGTGRLVQNGSGLLRITGSNTATGETVVNSGTVQIAAAAQVGGNLVVNGGGTLTGAGKVAGSLQLNSSGTVALGTGTLTVGQGATFAGGTFQTTLTDTSTYGSLNLTGGNVSLGEGTTTLAYTTPLTAVHGDRYLIINNASTGATTGYFAGLPSNTIVFTVNGAAFKIVYDYNAETGLVGGGNDVALIAAPEPAGALLLMLGGLWGLTRRRRSSAR